MILTIITSIKTFSLETMICIGIPFLIAFFSPISAMLIGTGFFIIADTFTGIWAALKRGDKIHSRSMARTVTKMIMYSLAVILAQLLQLYFFSWIPMASITAGYIALVEFYSNMENIGYITNIDILSYLKDKIDTFKPNKNKNIDNE